MDLIAETKKLKRQIAELTAAFHEQTKAFVIKIDFEKRGQQVNSGGRSRIITTESEVGAVVVLSEDGTKVEV